MPKNNKNLCWSSPLVVMARAILKRAIPQDALDGKALVIFVGNHRIPIHKGSKSGIEVRVENWFSFLKCITSPRITVGELYQAGRLNVIKGNLADFLGVLLRAEQLSETGFVRLQLQKLRRIRFLKTQSYNINKSKQNVHAHYDLGNEFYRTLTGPSLTYSCAFYESVADNLETAQRNKVNRALSRLGAGNPPRK